MNKIIFGVIGVVILAVGIYFIIPKNASETTETMNTQTENETQKVENENASSSGFETQGERKKSMDKIITITTKFGDITFETYASDAPKTVENFVTLANKGFYDKLVFHRVIKDFMIQGGDPNGNGTGGPGYKFEDELNPSTASYQAGYKKGVVAMANAGPNTNGSQFFIMLEDYPLPNNYTIFGKVISGQNVVDIIGGVKTGANDKPLEPVVMEKVTVKDK